METMECLNGTIAVGDRVAIAVGDGQYGGGMRIGEVVEFLTEHNTSRWRTGPAVRVKVTAGSGAGFGGYPYLKIFPFPRRIVKL